MLDATTGEIRDPIGVCHAPIQTLLDEVVSKLHSPCIGITPLIEVHEVVVINSFPECFYLPRSPCTPSTLLVHKQQLVEVAATKEGARRELANPPNELS